jgi:outer membrane receptor protein involved in Fe transport
MIDDPRIRRAIRLMMLGTALSSGVAQAQDVPAPDANPAQAEVAAPETAVSEPAAEFAAEDADIVVTGSRVLRSGFAAPTPVTVVGAERLQAFGDNNVGDALNRLPTFRPQSTPTSQGYTQANLGSQLLDLRGLGAQRTLVLLDGRRIAPSTTQGTVDVNLIPSAILGRTEVVTGGASAAYGSDAVAGVVNLIVDTRLKGFRGSAQYGITDEGDGEEVQVSLAYGSELFGGRGHIVLGGEYVNNDGVGDCFSRRWCSPDGISTYNVTTNSAGPGGNGQPATVVGLVRNATMTPAGLITNGPLRGTQFTSDGGVSQTPFAFGQNASPFALFMIGGDGANYFHRDLLISPPIERYSLFARTVT